MKLALYGAKKSGLVFPADFLASFTISIFLHLIGLRYMKFEIPSPLFGDSLMKCCSFAIISHLTVKNA